ncbi:MAG: adenosylcobalamin-dependent ribonucleoside-diphosphate reductase [Planctomycetes bacterium]|nr:adenosylcobalamin-dependent ribonucleoside-diphosphate reductase [Planctomycetota bacterium]NOG54964.1 adenosylcobalamin-dependent ribonucleoside-diphosphate reductase [Planctomycetota bacterium]
MRIDRRFTKQGKDVHSTVEWVERTSRISHPDGSVVFEMKDARIPAQWSQLSTDIMVSKYFRKAGVPQYDAEGNIARRPDGSVITGPEKSAKQVIHRLAGCWRHWGESHGYFDSREDAESFYDELSYMLLHQIAAPNSPQWFNTGLAWAYGLTGPAQGHYIVDPVSSEIQQAHDAYTHPQPHACFIQAVSDDLVNSGGIMDLWVREARLFKYGSGTGTNFSALRGEGEPLSGGGTSSGLMSWLRIGDRAAAAIKSGGTTRRAAKMVCLDADHPDIEHFINWKVREEIKVAALVEGMAALPEEHREVADRLGLQLDYDFNGEAYYTVSGQNSNNSIRIPDDFFDCVDSNTEWETIRRTDGSTARALPARKLWEQICYAAWRCADPGLQFDSTINSWHTCPESGRINASNPCSEYMFLDNTACNLASINLLKFYDRKNGTFDLEGFEHAIRLWTIVLEISVLMAAFPSAEIARLSYEYRTLGLGFANLGAMLMQLGIPYDSEEARALCSCITSILTGKAYAVSAEMARELGPFKGFTSNRAHMLRVMRNHRRAAHGVPRDSDHYEELRINPVPIDEAAVEKARNRMADAGQLHQRAMDVWNDALDSGEKFGYRNAQVSVIAPTGTIGLLMDCDTTGVEPDFALVKFKKLAGGGYFKIANNSLKPALQSLGYSDDQIKDILHYVLGSLKLDVPIPDMPEEPAAATDSERDPDAATTLADVLRSKGFSDDDLDGIEHRLPTVFEFSQAFGPWNLRPQLLEELGLEVPSEDDEVDKLTGADILRHIGLSSCQIRQLDELICGSQTVEGAPHVKVEHLPVFDCANPCGRKGHRYIRPEGHIRMMAAAQPFVSGAISKTINLPNHASVEDISQAYRLSWELGLKANALYRDGCKLSQPLNTRTDKTKEAKDVRGTQAVLTDEEVEVADLEATAMAHKEILTDVGLLAETVADQEDETAPAVASSADQTGSASSAAAAAADAGATGAGTTAGGKSGSTEKVRTVEKIVERIVERPLRRRLPDTRRSMTHKFNVASHEGYLTVGLYPDDKPGELFITMSKEGSTIGGLMDSLGTAISVALQYGVPLESLVGKFSYQRFEPAGITANRDIPFAKSLVDYIFRWLGIQFIPGFREQHAPHTVARQEENAGKPDLAETKPVQPSSSTPSVWKEAPAAPETTAESPKSKPTEAALTDRERAIAAAAASASTPSSSDDDSDSGPDEVTSDSDQPGTATAVAKRIGLDDPQQVREAAARRSPIAKLQADVQTVAAIADKANAQASAVGVDPRSAALERAMAGMMGDAPPCDKCGSMTVRNGSCYRCLNCGSSMGCS